MKKTKYRRLAAMAASLLCCLIFTVPAYAQSSEPQPETAPAPAETEAEPETQNPFTPDGTGTVVDNATDEDGKGVLHHHHSRRERVLSGDRQTENQRERLFPQYRYRRRPSASCRTG